jgi:hypothetical protein
MTALNPYLYERLVEYYGDVEIVCPGQAISWETVWTTVPGASAPVKQRRKLGSGEEYRVRCKLCRDWRPRLYINHRWGVWDPDTESQNLWLANCYNEACYSDALNQRRLYEILYESNYLRRGPQPQVVVLPGRVGEPAVLRPAEPPGDTIRLDQLAGLVPNHPALVYLRSRGFDPVKLACLYDLRYCTNSYFRWATNRIIIPIHQAGMLVGWQARHLGDDVGGVPFNQAKVPKYWTSPGMPRRLVAYNLERALQHSTVIVVEGPSDTWNTGPMALGLLGKTASPEIRAEIVRGMRAHPDGVVVIALDPKPDARDAARNRPHHNRALYSQLREPLAGRVLLFQWPNLELDPGSIDRDFFRREIRRQAAAEGLSVTFAKP